MSVNTTHPDDDALERYALGAISDESELAPLEEHLLACTDCLTRAERMEDYVLSVRSALSQSWIQVIESGG
jgi:anti-sigma factor RsiW